MPSPPSCPLCGEELPQTSTRCPNCGAHVADMESVQLCPKCNSSVRSSDLICHSCGARLKEAPTAPSPAGDVIECPSCGAENRIGDKECEICHLMLVKVVEPEVQRPEVHAPPKAAPRKAVVRKLKMGELDIAALKSTPPSRLVLERTVALYASLATIIPLYAMNGFGLAYRNELTLLYSVVLTGVAFATTILDRKSLRRQRRLWLTFLPGAIFLLLGSAIAGEGTFIEVTSFILILAGAAYQLQFARSPGSGLDDYFPWLLGCAVLLVLSISKALRPDSWSVSFLAAWTIPPLLFLLSISLVGRSTHIAAEIRERMSRAERAYRRHDFHTALSEYERVLMLQSQVQVENPELVLIGRANTLLALGELDDALKNVDTALLINKENELAWLNKGNALSKAGNLGEAERCYRKAIELNPAFEVGWNNLGNALARQGRNEEALKCYDKALSIDGNYRDAWINRGNVLAKMGDYKAAATCAEKALALTARA